MSLYFNILLNRWSFLKLVAGKTFLLLFSVLFWDDGNLYFFFGRPGLEPKASVHGTPTLPTELMGAVLVISSIRSDS